MTLNTTTLSTPDAVAVRSLDAWPQILATLGQYSSASMDLMNTPDIPVGAHTLHSRRPAAIADQFSHSTSTEVFPSRQILTGPCTEAAALSDSCAALPA